MDIFQRLDNDPTWQAWLKTMEDYEQRKAVERQPPLKISWAEFLANFKKRHPESYTKDYVLDTKMRAAGE